MQIKENINASKVNVITPHGIINKPFTGEALLFKAMKKCIRCGEITPFGEFVKSKMHLNGVRNYCKSCENKRVKLYHRTKDGLIAIIYSGQKSRSKIKGYPPPSYTKEELCNWVFSQKIFHKLFDNWVKSGYNKWLAPSCDRLNNNLPYSLDNIQLITWKQNYKNARKDVKLGLLKSGSPHKSVIQYTKDGIFVNKYVSIREASRNTKIRRQSISDVCLHKIIHAGGYKWKFCDTD